MARSFARSALTFSFSFSLSVDSKLITKSGHEKIIVNLVTFSTQNINYHGTSGVKCTSLPEDWASGILELASQIFLKRAGAAEWLLGRAEERSGAAPVPGHCTRPADQGGSYGEPKGLV